MASALPGWETVRALSSRVTLNDGAKIPVVGLGLWKMPAGRVTQQAVGAALSTGYRLFDTATLYGNERDLGEAWRASGLPRDDVYLTTKLWNDDQGYEPALRAFERSRAALGVDVIDLYLVHWPVAGKRRESWRALERIRASGAARSIGVSNYSVEHLEELLAEGSAVPAVDQVEFSPFLFQRELLEFCRRHRIQLEAYAPLTRGKRLDDPTIAAVAAAHRSTPAQVVLRWALQHEVIVIPKSVNPARIAENAGALSLALTESEMLSLDRLSEGYRTAWDPSSMA